MAYCTLADLVDRYGETEVLQLTDRNHDGIADTQVLDPVFADVDALIDAHLASRYALPLSSVPRVLVRLACDLVREMLMMAGGARLDSESAEKRAADAARGILRDLSKGLVSIGLPVPTASAGSVQMETGGRAWSREQAGGYL